MLSLSNCHFFPAMTYFVKKISGRIDCLSIHQRFLISSLFNFSVSYGSYLLLLFVLVPSAAYFLSYCIGLSSGSIVHIKFTHRKSLSRANMATQVFLGVGVGFVSSACNGVLSRMIDPRLSGLVVIVTGAILNFWFSRLLLR